MRIIVKMLITFFSPYPQNKSVVWTALLSAWYPPEEDENEIVVEEKKD